MVCDRCKQAVRRLLDHLGIVPVRVDLGHVTLSEPLAPERMADLRHGLEALGFELLDTRKEQLVEAIKLQIIRLIWYHQNELSVNLSDYLSSALHQEYSVLSKLFSEQTGTTIEKYFICQKIERVKELLADDGLSLNAIAEQLHYSSAAHLSTQFKKITGLSPREWLSGPHASGPDRMITEGGIL